MWYAVGDVDSAVQGDVVGLSAYQSHGSLLRRADYSCSDVRLPRVSEAEVQLKFDVINGYPRLYAKYTCRDRLVLKNPSRQFMYCSNRTWIGVLPACVIGMLFCNDLYTGWAKKNCAKFFLQ